MVSIMALKMVSIMTLKALLAVRKKNLWTSTMVSIVTLKAPLKITSTMVSIVISTMALKITLKNRYLIDMPMRLKNSFVNKIIHVLYRFKTLRTQTGQGLIEYLLVLVLTVSIVMAIMNGLGKPVARYMESIFEVVGCMLRVGEGPAIAFQLCGGVEALQLDRAALGGSGGASNKNGGKSSNDSSNNGGGGDSSNNGRGGDSSNPNQENNIKTPDGRGSIDGNGRDRSSGSSNFDGNPIDPDQPNRIKINEEEAGRDGSFSHSGSNQDIVTVRRISRKNEQINSGFTLIEKQRAINEGEFGSTTPAPIKKTAPESIEEKDRAVSGFAITDRKKQTSGLDGRKNSEDFSFIKLIKWGIIIAIIFIFMIFTLSQINNIRKGWTD